MVSYVEVEHFYWGKLIDGNTPRGDYRIIATSQNVTVDQADNYLSSVYMGSHERVNLEHLTHSYSFSQVDTNRCVFSHVRSSRVADRGHKFPVYHGIILPIEVLHNLNLSLLQELAGTDLFPPEFNEIDTTLAPLSIPTRSNAPHLKYVQFFEKRQAKVVEILFDAILSKKFSVLIDDAPTSPSVRLGFIQAIWETLPESQKHLISFSTDVFESSETKFKVKYLFTGGYGKSETDLLLDFKTLRLDNQPHEHNWLSTWVANCLSDGQLILTEFTQMKRAIDNNLARVVEIYPNLLPADQLSLASAFELLKRIGDKATSNTNLLMTLLNFHQLLPKVEQKRLAITLFERGLQIEKFDIWSPLIANNLVYRFQQDLTSILQTTSNNKALLGALRYWVSVGDPLQTRTILSLFSAAEAKFVAVISVDEEITQRIVEFYWVNKDYQALQPILNSITEEKRIIHIFEWINKHITEQEQLDELFAIVKSIDVSPDVKKRFYFTLVNLSPQSTSAVSIELLDQHSANHFTLTHEEKLYLLSIELPQQYRNTLFQDMVNSAINGKEYTAILDIVNAYQSKFFVTEAASMLFSNQEISSFTRLTAQILDFFERTTEFSELFDDHAKEEIGKEFSSLSETERNHLQQNIENIINHLEHKGMLARTLPINAALKQVVNILKND